MAPVSHMIDADLAQLGTPSDSVLLLDEQNGGLLPDVADAPLVIHTGMRQLRCRAQLSG